VSIGVCANARIDFR